MNHFLSLLSTLFFINTLAAQTSAILHGTTIIGYMTKDTIWIAADSKLNGDTTKKFTNTIKLTTAGNYIGGFAGITDYESNGTLLKFAIEEFKRAATISDPSEFISLYIKLTVDDLNSLFNKGLISAKYLNEKNGYLASTIIAYFKNGISVMKYVDFKADRKADGSFSIVYNLDSAENKEILLYMGYHEECKSFMNNNPDYLKAKPTCNQLKKLIGLEVERLPEQVNEPIDIIKLDRTGSNWEVRHDYIHQQ